MGYISQTFNESPRKKNSFSIPIGTKQPLFVYRTQRGKYFIPEEDIVYIRIAPKEQFSLMCIMPTGYGKTRFLKRILPYLTNKHLFKTLIFDCKGFEMYHAKFRTNDYNSLLPWERPEAIDLKCYMPSFVRKKAEEYRLFDSSENKYLQNFNTFSFHLDDVTDVLEASTLGMAPHARLVFLDKIKTAIKEGEVRTTEEILTYIRKLKIPFGSKENLLQVFSFFAKERFFDPNYPKINVAKDWKRDFTVNISLLEPEEGQASFYAGKIIADLYSSNAAEGKNKLIVVDDASKLLGSKMKQDEFLSVKKVIDTLTLGRYKKWHVIVLSQSYDILNRDIFPHFKYKIVGKLGASDLNFIQAFCSPDVTFAIKTLNYDPARQIKEMLLIHPDNMSFTRFYALGPLTLHL